MKVLAGEAADKMKVKIRSELAYRAAKHDNVLEWGKYCFPEKFKLDFCYPLHNYFVQIRKEAFTNTEAPRGHAKTVIKCFLIPIYQALNEGKEFQHYLNVQSTEPKALSINTSIMREVEENPVLRELYGDQVSKELWTASKFRLNNGVIFSTIGAGQSIRGINYRNYRPDYLVIDDLYDEEDINNPEATEKKNAWFWGSLYPARATDRKTSVHIQGTAINAEDLMEKLKKNPSIKSSTFRAITDWDKKEILWPVEGKRTFETLHSDMENMGSLIFFREMQNERRDDTTSIIKRTWLNGWEYDPTTVKFGDVVKVLGVYLCVDPSIGEKSENDPTAIALIYKTRIQGNSAYDFFVADLWQGHITLDQRVKKLQAMAYERGAGMKVNQCRIESISGFKDFAAEVKRRTNLPVKDIPSVKDKLTNLENKSGSFENRHVHISKAIPEALRDTLIYQLTTNHPKNDDLRDAVLLGIDQTMKAWEWI